MAKQPRLKSSQRRYPPFWERAVPVLLLLIGLAVVALVIISLAVLLGWL